VEEFYFIPADALAMVVFRWPCAEKATSSARLRRLGLAELSMISVVMASESHHLCRVSRWASSTVR